MNKKLTFSTLALSLAFLFFAYQAIASVNLGLVSDGNPKTNAKAAYEWAQKNFNAKIIPAPNSKAELKKYGVIWWDESDASSIPARFLEKQTVGAFKGYVEDGGGLLLSSLAFHYVFEMGVESTQPRYFGRADNSPLDWTDFQIAKGQEGHPVFKGMKVEKGLIQYDIKGWTQGSDFYPNKPKKGKVLADTVDGKPSTSALCEYSVGKGAIVIIGWVWTAWVVNKHLEDVHGKLYTNIINYLASKSLFAPVEPVSKAATTWGKIKSNHTYQLNNSNRIR